MKGNSKIASTAVEQLSRIRPADDWIVSCYLKLEPRDRSRRKYLIKLKNRIKAQLAWLEKQDIGRSDREQIRKDLERVRDHLEDSEQLPAGQGIAVFASGKRNLFEAVPLPTVFRSRLAVDRTPLIRELASVADEFGLMACAVYDRTSARFFRVTALGVDELEGLSAGQSVKSAKFRAASVPTGRGTSTGATGEHNFHRRIAEQKQRHYAQIAERLTELVAAEPVRGVVLAGVGAGAPAVEPHLSPFVRRLYMGSARLNPQSATPAQVLSTAVDLRRKAERRWEAQHVQELRERIGNKWAVDGVEKTLAALARGQVRTLLVDPDLLREGFRCAESGKLTLVKTHCKGHGDPVPVQDVIDECIEEALRQGCHLDVLEDDELARQIDGLAGLLRFRS